MSKKIISLPPTYFYLSILISFLGWFFFPEFNFIEFPYNLFGILGLIFGMFLILKSYYNFKAKETPEDFSDATCVVCEGLYKYSRNPMYLGAIIFLLGVAVLFGNYISFIGPILFFIIINWMFIPFEEEKMEKSFGKKYLDYKKKVRRWI